jgi:hypothetical protein
MNRLMVGALMFLLGAANVSAQSLDDLNIQIHGYATQGFLYTTNNNIFTANSSNGSPEWTEAVLNVTAQPSPKLRVGVQSRYFLLGNLGNSITLDWAAADYKVSDAFGVRFGKVKTPSGLFNEIQDIDPGYIWALLPQGVYPLESRNSLLAHFGGVVYGTVKFGPQLGKLEYRGWAGERAVGSDDGYFVSIRESGIVLTNGLHDTIYGAALHWRTPLPGFMLGISNNHTNPQSGVLTDTVPGYGTFNGSLALSTDNQTMSFARYEIKKFMFAAEYTKTPTSVTLLVPGVYSLIENVDYTSWYGMASYKLTGKLTGGIYHTQFFNYKAPLGPARYSKDWAFSARFDFSQYLYAKAEQHFINGTAIGYDTTLNPPTAQLPTGLQPTTRLTILKMGVTF